MTAPLIHVYHHTHWDREWYLPFRLYQQRLVPVVQAILERLEQQQIPCFVLDGQTEILKDVLELRPDFEPRLRALIQAGRLTIGPWRVMPDEMLVSGESLLRNLIGGIRTSRAWGCEQFTGYLPDTFGHSADIPLILNQVGLDSAVVWRGVNPARSLFYWSHPSGAAVLTLHLTDGYFQDALHDSLKHNNGFNALTPPETVEKARRDQMDTWLAKTTPASPDDRVLLPLGADHLGPIALEELAFLKDWAPEAKATTPERYLAATDPALLPQLESIQGPLLDCSTSFLLPGTWSSRMYLKQANRRLEHQLTRWVEPLLAWQQLCFPDATKPEDHASLELAWTQLLLNHPHDSICGCSVDSVHRENEVRFEQVGQLAESLTHNSRVSLADRLFPNAGADQWVLWNMGDRPWRGVVPVREWVDSALVAPPPTDLHQLAREETVLEDSYRNTTQIVPLAHRTMTERHGWIWVDTPIPPHGAATQVKTTEAVALPEDIPLATGTLDPETALPRLDNGLLDISLTKTEPDGVMTVCVQDAPQGQTLTLSLTVQPDAGDSYTSALCSADQVQTAILVDARLEHLGPLVCSMILRYQFKRPVTVLPIEIRLQLTANDPTLEIDYDFIPSVPDQKLQVRLHPDAPLKRLWLESHFGLQERPLYFTPVHPVPAEKGQELPTATHPLQRFLVTGYGEETASYGMAIFTEGLTEAETYLDAIGITLWRGFGVLSRPDTGSRGGQAGPPLPTQEGQCLGRAMHGRLGLSFVDAGGEGSFIGLWEQANRFYGVVSGEQGRALETAADASMIPAHCLLRWDNPAVVSTACYLDTLPSGEPALVLRLLNPTDQPQPLRLTLGFSYRGIQTGNALGEDIAPVVGNQLVIQPYGLETVWIMLAD